MNVHIDVSYKIEQEKANQKLPTSGLFYKNATYLDFPSLWSDVIIPCILLPSINYVVASANNIGNSSFVTFGRSLIDIITNKGPSMAPGGTPHVIDSIRENFK